MKNMCGSDEPHPYPVRGFVYRTEHIRANEIQRVIVYAVLPCGCKTLLHWLYCHFRVREFSSILRFLS